MASSFGGSMSEPSENNSCSGSNGNDTASFECNICFELAQDPIVTLCGHLFCWPCLYKWLRVHARVPECPVCKAIIQEEKLVPLYGRGKNPTDPRSKSVPGVHIPSRPTGQRPETAPHLEQNHFPQNGGFNVMGGLGGYAPMATWRFGNFMISGGLGGLFPSLLLNVHGVPHPAPYGGHATGFPYSFSNTFHGGHAHGFPQPTIQGQQADSYLKFLLMMVGMFVFLALLCP